MTQMDNMASASLTTPDGEVVPYSFSINDSGGVKNIQRGAASGAVTITISAVDMSKTVIYSVGKGNKNTAQGSTTYTTQYAGSYSVQLTSSTTLESDGSCEWQAVEYY